MRIVGHFFHIKVTPGSTRGWGGGLGGVLCRASFGKHRIIWLLHLHQGDGILLCRSGEAPRNQQQQQQQPGLEAVKRLCSCVKSMVLVPPHVLMSRTVQEMKRACRNRHRHRGLDVTSGPDLLAVCCDLAAGGCYWLLLSVSPEALRCDWICVSCQYKMTQ